MLLKLDVRTLVFQTLQTNPQALYWNVNGLENEFIVSFWGQIIEGIPVGTGCLQNFVRCLGHHARIHILSYRT